MIEFSFVIFEYILMIQFDRMNNNAKNDQIPRNNQLSLWTFAEISIRTIILRYIYCFVILEHFLL